MRPSKLAILTLFPLAMGGGITQITAAASAQPLNSLDQTAQPLEQIVPPYSPIDSPEIEALNVTLPFSQSQTAESLMAQARDIAHRLIAQTFADNSNATATEVVILSDRNGEIVPLLVVRVSRENWRSNPNVEQWSWYLTTVGLSLLSARERQPLPTHRVPRRTVSRNAPPTTDAPATSPATVIRHSGPATATAMPSQPATSSRRSAIPVSTGAREDYVMPGTSLEDSDPGYR